MFRSRKLFAAIFSASLALLSLPIIAQDAMTYQQAPMLDAMVADSSLPPVAERLPSQLLVVTPLESVGEYGGTWHMGT